MKRVLGAVTALSLFLGVSQAFAQGSTINVNVPAQGSPLQSAPIRNNFVAAATDINNLMSMFAGNSAPPSPVTFQQWANPSVNPAQLSIFDGTQFVVTGLLDRVAHTYSPVLASTSVVGTAPITAIFSGGVATVGLSFDSNFAVSGSSLALNPISAGQMLANCTGSTAEPTTCTWNNFANQAIGNTNGMLPYRVGGLWGTISTGTSGGTVPLNNTANVFSAIQSVNLNGSALPTAQTGSLLQLQQANATISRVESDSYAAAAIFTGVRADGTAASPTGLVNADEIASLNAFGYDGTARGGPAAALRLYAGGTWSGTNHQTYIDMATTPSGSTTLTSRFQVSTGLISTGVTGGDQGAGTINVAAAYIEGAALSAVAANITPGVSLVEGGAANGLLYENASGFVAQVTVVNSGVVSTTSGGVPQVSTTLPSNIAATSMALTTPNLGVATATSINKVAITAPASSATLTIANGKTLTASNSLTFTGTDATSFAFPGASDTVATIAATQTLTNKTLASSTDVLGGVTMTLGSDATGDMYYRSSGGQLTRLAVGGAGTVLGISAGLPGWVAGSSASTVTVASTAIASGTSEGVLFNSGGVLGNTAAGNVGQHLTSNGSGSAPTYNDGGWTLLNTLTASNSASLQDTTSISASYSEYEIVLEQVLPATNLTTLEMQFRIGGSFQTANYVSSDSYANGTTNGTEVLTSGVMLSRLNATANAGSGVSGRWLLSNPGQTLTCKNLYGESLQITTPAVIAITGGCYNGGSGAITGLSLMAVSGNLTSGVMKIYGRSN